MAFSEQNVKSRILSHARTHTQNGFKELVVFECGVIQAFRIVEGKNVDINETRYIHKEGLPLPQFQKALGIIVDFLFYPGNFANIRGRVPVLACEFNPIFIEFAGRLNRLYDSFGIHFGGIAEKPVELPFGNIGHIGGNRYTAVQVAASVSNRVASENRHNTGGAAIGSVFRFIEQEVGNGFARQ